MTTLPTKARAVIIGGGVVGCSVAYHLTKLGWTDVVLLERKQLTSGTTWHAAGLIGQLRASANMTCIAKYSADIYTGLEAETGVATGMKTVGSISVALTDERKEELFRNAAMARSARYSCTVPIIAFSNTISTMAIASSGSPTIPDTSAAASRTRIIKSVNWLASMRHQGRCCPAGISFGP